MIENQSAVAFRASALTAPSNSTAILDFILQSVVEFVGLRKDAEPESIISDVQTVLIPKIAQLVIMIASFSTYFNLSKLNADKVLVVETVVNRLSVLPVSEEMKDKVTDIVLAAIFTSFIAIKPGN